MLSRLNFLGFKTEFVMLSMLNFLGLKTYFVISLHGLFFLGFNTENQSWLVITLMQKFLELICLLHVIACAVFFLEN